MASARARRLHLETSKRVRITHPRGPRWSPIWDGNPHIARPEERGVFETLVDGPGMRPYVRAFDAKRWTFHRNIHPEPGDLFLTPEELALAIPGAVIVEPNIKASASPNKRWSWARWQAVVDALPLPWVQMSGPYLERVQRVAPASFRQACGVMSKAAAYVGHEGGLHHSAAALGIPGVVIFGGFVSPDVTGYAMHTNIFTGGEPCGMRQRCDHCRAAMQKITVEMVVQAVETVIGNS